MTAPARTRISSCTKAIRRAPCVSSTTKVMAGADLSCPLAAMAIVATNSTTRRFGESGVDMCILESHDAVGDRTNNWSISPVRPAFTPPLRERQRPLARRAGAKRGRCRAQLYRRCTSRRVRRSVPKPELIQMVTERIRNEKSAWQKHRAVNAHPTQSAGKRVCRFTEPMVIGLHRVCES